MDDFMSRDLKISDIVLCAVVSAGMGKPLHRNRASHGLVYYPCGGCRFDFIGEKSISLSDNSIIYLPKGSDYNVVKCKRFSECYAINFQLSDDFSTLPFSVSLRNRSFFSEAFGLAAKVYTGGKPGYLMKCRSILCDIISVMQSEHSLGYVSGRERQIISPAVDTILETYTAETPSVTELAALCGISVEYFRLLFKKEFGVSPICYINDLRFRRAKDLLDSGLYSVSQACFMAGFGDISYFSRHFKKNFGISPLEYSKRQK